MSNIFYDLLQWLHDVFVAQWDWWTLLGLVGQICFTMRFVVQWLASELAKKSVIPVAFWIFSLIGGGLLLVYSVYLKNPVFILGNSMGFFVYLRNLWLIYFEKKNQIALENS